MKLKYIILFAYLGVLNFSCTNNKEEFNEKRPNIIFIMSDDHAYQAISAYNSGLIETPNIDKIAKEGIIFNKAFVTNSICSPSRAVILTGKFSHLNGVIDNVLPFDGTQQTLPKMLQSNGYRTGLVGKWHLKSDPIGFDYWNILPGQGDYYNPGFIKQGKDTVYSGYVTDIITDISLEWLKQNDKDEPFCLMMHHKASHSSWMPALKNLELFDDKDFPLPETFYDDYEGREALKKVKFTVQNHMDTRLHLKVPCMECDTIDGSEWAPREYLRRIARLTPEQRKVWDENYKKEEIEFYQIKDDKPKRDQWIFRRYMEDYLRVVTSIDESVGRVLDFLKENGLEENTIIVYTSDQGFYLGEHGLYDKRFMYEQSLRTPLVIRYPKEIKPGTETDLLVQNLDFMPTLLDVAGISVPDDIQGQSMRPIWNADKVEWRDAIYYHYYHKKYGLTPHYGVRTDRYKLIHFFDVIDSWELYDLKTDPNEMKNLYEDPTYEKTKNLLKTKLISLQSKYKIPQE